MRTPDLLAGAWTSALRTVLPQRGAVANARSAVEHDSWAAARRREARADALVPGPRGEPRPGLALTEEERSLAADVTPLPGFTAAAETALPLLAEVPGIDVWLVTAVGEGVQRVVAAAGAGAGVVPVGAFQPWAESYCREMVAGRGPRVAPRAREHPAYATSPAAQRWGIAAYVGVPLLAADGRLAGTVCGLAATEQGDGLADHLPAVERVARLLSTVLAKEAAASERSSAAAEAYALAERDLVTGLLNARGWHRRLSAEAHRVRRAGHPASVVVVAVGGPGAGGPAVPSDGPATRPGGEAGASDPDRRLEPRPGEPDVDLLRAVGMVLARICRPTDAVARLGPAELAVLAVDCPAPQAARLARRIGDHLRSDGIPARLGVGSAGPRRDLLEAWRRAQEQAAG